MRTSKSEDWIIVWLNYVSVYVLMLCIFIVFVFTVTDVVTTDLMSQVIDNTEIPISLYKIVFAFFYIFGFIWMISEWYIGKTKNEETRHNVAHNFLSLFITTLVVLIYTMTQNTGFYIFAVFFSIIYFSAVILLIFHRILLHDFSSPNYHWINAPLGLFRTEYHSKGDVL